MKVFTSTRQIGSYVRSKMGNGVYPSSYSEKGKTHQRMAWVLDAWNNTPSDKKVAKVVRKLQKKLINSGITAEVYVTKATHALGYDKINIKMPIEQHQALRKCKVTRS